MSTADINNDIKLFKIIRQKHRHHTSFYILNQDIYTWNNIFLAYEHFMKTWELKTLFQKTPELLHLLNL